MKVECYFGNKRPIKINLNVDGVNMAECRGCVLHKNGGRALVISQEVVLCEKKEFRQAADFHYFGSGPDKAYFASEPE
jgi:hypothetical protein